MTEHDHNIFLEDKDFISWCLTGDPSLDTFWKEYLELHPEQKEALETAIRQLSNIKLNPERLTLQEEDQLLDRIHSSTEKRGRKRYLLRFARYAAAACILMASGLFFFYQHEKKQETSLPLSDNLIVGQNLDEKDIYLITDTKTTSFAKDVRVQINEEGSAIVEEVDGGKSSVIETGNTVINKLVVPYGKRSQLILADGSKVWINSGSVLEFPSSFAGNTRTLSLTGEMFIEVAKDQNKPFIVNTPDFQVKVYGTQFNISAYQDDNTQSVVLVSGSVSVKSKSNEEAILQPNEMLIYKEHDMEKRLVEVNQYISWKDGYISMNETPIAEVLKLVERYYNLSFKIRDNADLRSRTCTGKLYLSDNMDNVMNTVSILSSIKYTREGKTIYIDINP